ncbi:MAG TPA: FKBP-type peptidyl-prolyl cis-trans isomerase [Flavitalea sp.]|nr:FKBP-type peptidyl-prolyl cis-trans isomerase [Flavitalea sp.]
MLKNLFFIFGITIAGVSCLKSSERTCAYPVMNITAPEAEQDSIQNYLDSNNIEAVHDPSGFYYKILNPGSGTEGMKLCSEILIDYKGQFKNGQIFDQANDAYLVLGALIEGWKKGIPLIKKGGEINLYIPPTLGYGNKDLVDKNTGAVLIPANSMLIFNVKLKDYTPGY